MPEPPADFTAVIPAGGAGTRLWPLSRSGSPKFLHDLTGSGRTLIQQTVDRLRPLAGDRLLVVTGALHGDAVRAQLPDLTGEQVLIEPSPRDSMAAIGWAAAVIEARNPDAVLGSFAADHVVRDQAAFERVIVEAVDIARADWLVTIGITPTFPATGFGYIQCGRRLAAAESAHRVRQFVEKPDAAHAAAYLATGEFLWNAGMFVVRAGRLLDLLAQWQPDFTAALRALARQPETLEEVWRSLPRIAIDHAVAEPAARHPAGGAVPADFGWDDIGDFNALTGILPPPPSGPTVLGEATLVSAIDAGGLVVPSSGRPVVVLGLPNVVVIDTPDVLFVTSTDRAQDVKAVVDHLREHGHTNLT